MKTRIDFVSNSSSSSFMIKKQDGVTDFFVEFKDIISEIDCIFLYFTDSESFTGCLNYLMKNPSIKDYCLSDPENKRISLAASLYSNRVESCVHDCISVIPSAAKIEFYIDDNFNEHSCRLLQLATLAEYKGLELNIVNMDHEPWILMKERLNENEN